MLVRVGSREKCHFQWLSEQGQRRWRTDCFRKAAPNWSRGSRESPLSIRQKASISLKTKPLTCRPKTGRTVKATQKWWLGAKPPPLRAHFQNSSTKVQQRTAIDICAQISCWSVPLEPTKMRVNCSRYKNSQPFYRRFGPPWPRAPKF